VIAANIAIGARAAPLFERAGGLKMPAKDTPISPLSRALELNPVENVWRRQIGLATRAFETHDAGPNRNRRQTQAASATLWGEATMTAVRTEVFEALREIGIPEDKALKAAAALSNRDVDVDRLKTTVTVVKWMTAGVLAFQVAILLEMLVR
jgi:hypothetical protein